MIRVLLVDDHRLFRVGLARMLREAKTIDVAGEADSGEEAVRHVRRNKPDVVLMDLNMPGIGGLEATRRITRMERAPKVIAVTAYDHNPFPVQVLRAGALGYLTKDINSEELVTAIKRVYVGKQYVSTEIAQELASSALSDSLESPFDNLSNREMQIMLMVVNCHKVNDISSDLHLSPKTVNSYRYRIFEKLNVKSDVELALMAVRHGMVNAQA